MLGEVNASCRCYRKRPPSGGPDRSRSIWAMAIDGEPGTGHATDTSRRQQSSTDLLRGLFNEPHPCKRRVPPTRPSIWSDGFNRDDELGFAIFREV